MAGLVGHEVNFEDRTLTLRGALRVRLFMAGAPWALAKAATARTLMEHPEWDTTEMRAFEEWEEFLATQGLEIAPFASSGG